VQCGGSVVSKERRHASVIEEVPLGLMRRIWMRLVDFPVTDARGEAELDIWNENRGSNKKYL
jgi:hypothetical protein